MTNLAGKLALVTGASKGIGFAAAEALAAEGCDVMLAARDPEALAAAKAKLEQYPGRISTYALDLAQSTSWTILGDAAPDLDILINNAGAIKPGALDEIDDRELRAGYDLKLFGYIGLTRIFYPRMRARRCGVIVNVMGTNGQRPVAGSITTGMANAALSAMTVALGAESPKFGVRVIGVNPGAVATERAIDAARALAETEFGDADRWPELMASLPFGRMARADELGSMIMTLCSDRASYVSGTVITIDGGNSARQSSLFER